MQKEIVHRLSGRPQNKLNGYASRTKFRKLEGINEGQEVGNTAKVMLQEESEEGSVPCASATGHSPPSQVTHC